MKWKVRDLRQWLAAMHADAELEVTLVSGRVDVVAAAVHPAEISDPAPEPKRRRRRWTTEQRERIMAIRATRKKEREAAAAAAKTAGDSDTCA